MKNISNSLYLIQKIECDGLNSNYDKEKTKLRKMRIPSIRNGGVIRIYFIQNKYDNRKILLHDGEIKHQPPSSIKDNLKNFIRPKGIKKI